MALIKADSQQALKTKLTAWKTTPPNPATDFIIYHRDEVGIEKNEIINVCFKQGFVVDVESYYGRLDKVVYIGVLV